MNTINTNLGQRIKKDVFCLVVSMGQKKKFPMSPYEVSSPDWDAEFFFVPHLQ